MIIRLPNSRDPCKLNSLIKNVLLPIFFISIITVIGYIWYENLGLTGITMLYLLFVVGVAYANATFVILMAALSSFLLINYFFVAPKFTFHIAHIASWASLISFLIVSFIITTLVKQLKLETLKSKEAYLRAEFLRKTAEVLSYADDHDRMLNDSQNLLQNELGRQVVIIKNNAPVKSDYTLNKEELSAIQWSRDTGQLFGVATNNWSNVNFLVVPFTKLKSDDPVVLIPEAECFHNYYLLDTVKLAVAQISVAYQHLLQKQKTLLAEHQAREETVKSALLASIAHDMRTPLTSILGAATTLETAFNNDGTKDLIAIVSSQAKYLARATENILSLVRLESLSIETIAMELQSLEEIAATVVNLYHFQNNAPNLSVNVRQPDLLIYANHDLIVLALINLVENAKQANADNNNPNAIITITLNEAANKVFIQVTDHGTGFSEGFNASHIKKFQSSRSKGFGLGLPIVEAVTKLHCASLNFDKAENKGAVVSLIFDKPEIDTRNV